MFFSNKTNTHTHVRTKTGITLKTVHQPIHPTAIHFTLEIGRLSPLYGATRYWTHVLLLLVPVYYHSTITHWQPTSTDLQAVVEQVATSCRRSRVVGEGRGIPRSVVAGPSRRPIEQPHSSVPASAGHAWTLIWVGCRPQAAVTRPKCWWCMTWRKAIAKSQHQKQ